MQMSWAGPVRANGSVLDEGWKGDKKGVDLFRYGAYDCPVIGINGWRMMNRLMVKYRMNNAKTRKELERIGLKYNVIIDEEGISWIYVYMLDE